jgi:DNA-directed RNA polymerase subunit H (RpoH/RPB5)
LLEFFSNLVQHLDYKCLKSENSKLITNHNIISIETKYVFRKKCNALVWTLSTLKNNHNLLVISTTVEQGKIVNISLKSIYKGSKKFTSLEKVMEYLLFNQNVKESEVQKSI